MKQVDPDLAEVASRPEARKRTFDLAPQISVLMPVFNGEPYLAEAVQSILAQSFAEFELIAVDDGSNDASLETLQAYADADPRVRIISQANAGIVAALNNGLRFARGDYVARMDADDVAHPNRLFEQKKYLDAHPDVVAVGAQVIRVDEGRRPINVSSCHLDHEEIDKKMLSGRGAIFHPTAMIRLDALQSIGGYRDFPYAEDLDLFLRLSEVGRLANMREALLDYRLLKTSFTLCKGLESDDCASDPVKTDAISRILRDAYDRRGLPSPSDFAVTPRSVLTSRSWRQHLAQMALQGQNYSTARHHAFAAVLQSPIVPYSWRLLLSSIVRRQLKSLGASPRRRLGRNG